MRSRLRALGTLVGTAFEADAGRTTALLAITLAGAAGGALTALWVKLLIDGAVGGRLDLVVVAAAGLGASQTLLWLAFHANFTVSVRVDEATGHLLQRRLLRAALEPDGISHLEQRETVAKLELLRASADWLGHAGSVLAWPAGNVLGLAAGVALLATVHPLLLLLPVLTIPAALTSIRAQRLLEATVARAADRRRTARTLFDVATGPGGAREVRLFALGPALVGRHASIWATIEAEEAVTHRRSLWWSVVATLLFTAGYLAALLFVGVEVLQGRASAGDLLLTFLLGGQMSRQIAGLTTMMPRVLRVLDRISVLRELEEDPGARPVEGGAAAVPAPLADGIRLDGVHFRYPGTDRDVLSDVQLHLPAGAVVALVGDNGAGKTTLVKLLTRLYDATSGEVTVDGTDLRQLAPDEWRQHVAAGFQDFVRFELVAREVVGVGDLPHVEDVDAVTLALARASAGDVVGTLPRALGTQLGPSFEGGHDPSGGQWQKLALGRAMMRREPVLLVLDEPTASLDADTEHALFSRYADAARRVSGGRGITLLVTHRFSTVRVADVIVVLERGRVIEVGSHGDLVAQGGLYAELYELQARAYR